MLVEGDKGVYYAESHARACSRRYRAVDMNSRVEKDKEDGWTYGRDADGPMGWRVEWLEELRRSTHQTCMLQSPYHKSIFIPLLYRS